MSFDSTIRRRVRSIAKDERGKLTEKDVFSSEELRAYLENLSVSLKSSNPSTINIFEGERDGDVAWTNGQTINLNWNNSIVWYFPNPEQRFVAFMGLFFHEVSHDLFCDFNEEMRAMSFLEKGLIYGDPPSKLSAQEDADWADMLSALNTPAGLSIILQVYRQVSNTIDDVHDENALIDTYGAFVGEGIFLCRNALHASCLLFEDMNAQSLKGEQTDLTIAYNLLLQMARFDDVLCRDEASLKASRFWTMLEKVHDHAVIACATDDKMRQFSEINYIMLALWPFIRTQIQQAKNQNQPGTNVQTQNSSDSGKQGKRKTQSQKKVEAQSGAALDSMTAEQIQKIMEQLSNGATQSGQTKAPEKKHSSDNALQRRINERKGEKNTRNIKPGGISEPVYASIRSLQEKIAEHKAEQVVEAALKQSMTDAVFACNQTASHKGIPLQFTRNLEVLQEDKDKYIESMRPLSAVSKRLQRQIVDALRDTKEGYLARHRVIGNKIWVNDVYRPDGRFFANNKRPQDIPDMAISVLVDHSGSMSGERIKTAMQASMLLYDFAKGIGIPISISGHRSNSGQGVEYITYTGYDSVGENDKYRLSKMEARGNNRDGMALNIAAGMLEARPEQIKLLIIISDGRPNHTNYGGEEAQKDIQEIVRNCKRKGIEVIAAAIGDDRKQIQEIYTEEFLDITDLKKLPKIMTNIVKKRVLKHAY